MNDLLKEIAMINWVIGMILIGLSNASGIIKYGAIKRTGWGKYRVGYSIKEIKAYIKMIDDEETIKRLERKILFRRLYPIFFISTIVYLFIANR